MRGLGCTGCHVSAIKSLRLSLIEAPYDNRRGAKAILPYLVPPGSLMRGLGANALHLTRLGHRDGG